jgi:hypothetical protein
MNQRFNGLWLVALVAVAGMFGLAPQTTPPAPSSTSAVSADKQTPPPGTMPPSTAKEILQDYYGANPGRIEPKILFASLPDPVDARAAYKFDEILEAIQTGAQDSEPGFVLDRFYLAWARPVSVDQDHPGILLFRDPTGKIALVFLVSETPTMGIHKNALIRALDEAEEIQPLAEIRLIGPNFSGSARSLQFALTEWFQKKSRPNVTVHFLSGNATGPDARKFLDPGPDVWSKGLSVYFHGLIWSDEVVQKAIDDYLYHRLGVEKKRVAILSESESAYGQQLLQGPASEEDAIYRFAFPLHISQLRTSYRDDPKLRTKPVSIADDPVRAALDLSFDEAAAPIDIPLPYSPGPTANLAELALYNIISGMSREHVRYVGLYATDGRDKLFLARLMRSYFPTVQFFTNDNDLLYTHPHYAAEMAGMLVASTYPLSNQSQTWNRMDKPKPIRQFSSQGAEGTYNATIAAFKFEKFSNGDDHLLEDTGTILKDYDDPFHAVPAHPGPWIWISEVGSERLWPISVYPWSGGEAKPFSNSKRSHTFTALFGGFGVLCLVVSGLVLRSSRAKLTRMERVHRFVLCVSLLLLFSIIAAEAYFTLKNSLLPQFARVADVMVILLLGLAASTSMLRAVRPHMSTMAVRLLSPLLALLLLLGFLLSPLALTRRLSPYDILLSERATRLESGISPFVPLALLIAGVCTWVCCDLKRLEWLHCMSCVNPFGRPVGGITGLVHLRMRINRTLACWHMGLGTRAGSGCVAAIVVISSVAILLKPFTTAEGWPFGWTLRLAFAVLLAALIGSATRFLLIWYQLRRLLRWLSFHPLAGAFERLDPKFSRGLGTHISAAPPTRIELEEPVNMLRRLEHLFEQGGSQARRSLLEHVGRFAVAIDTTYRSEVESASRRVRRVSAFRSRTQALLSRAAALTFRKLELEWKSPSADAATVRSSEDFVAVQIVAFLDYVFLHLRYLLVCTACGAILLLLAASTYPFDHQYVLINFSWTLILVMAFIYLVIFMEMSRNRIVAGVAKGPDGSDINRRRLEQFLIFGIIPLVTFLGSKFPAFGHLFSSWMSPLLKVLNL